jgi:hypothetical protein
MRVDAVPKHCRLRMAADLLRAEFYCQRCGETRDARFHISATGSDGDALRVRPTYTGKIAHPGYSSKMRQKALRLWRKGARPKEIAKALGLGPRGFETIQRWVVLSRRRYQN